MSDMDFSDLLSIRVGQADMTSGGGPTHMTPITSAAEWEPKAAALREIYQWTLGEQPYSDDIHLDISVEQRVDCGSFEKRVIRYNTGPNERVTGYLFVPHGLAGPTPAVLCLHQTIEMGKEQIAGNDSTPQGQDLAIALHLVRRGFITFAYDLWGAGERRVAGAEAFDTASFYVRHPDWSLRGKETYDIARAIDLLQTMPEVDAGRIGSIGHSLGGGHTVHAMAMEPRIRAGVCNCGIWPCRIAKNPFAEARASWWTARPRLRPFCLTGKPFPSQIHEVMALAAPRALMNISALNDCMYTAEESNFTSAVFENMASNIRRVYQLHGRESAFVNITHLNGHAFRVDMRERAYDFLARHLQLAAPASRIE